jgi:hypothetical protein
MKPTVVAWLIMGLFISLNASAESAVTVKETEVKKEPSADSPTVATLPGKAQVEIIKRQGGWTQIKPASEPQGWVKLFNLKFGDGSAKPDSGGGVGSLFNVARTGSSGTTVTTGVKGLDKDMIQNASPNPNELKRMHTYSASKGDALKLASSGNLRKQSIEYLGAGSGGSSGGAPSSTSPWENN